MRTINQAGLEIIQYYEGFRGYPYLDAGGIPTIGYGTTYYLNGDRVSMEDARIDEPTASRLFLAILNQKLCPELDRWIQPNVTSNQFSALGSLAYNIGMGNFKESTALLETNQGNFKAAAEAFLLWNKEKGVILPGLISRRKAESELYLT